MQKWECVEYGEEGEEEDNALCITREIAYQELGYEQNNMCVTLVAMFSSSSTHVSKFQLYCPS